MTVLDIPPMEPCPV